MNTEQKYIQKWSIREPNDAELKKFQKSFLAKKRKEEYHAKIDAAYKDGMKDLLFLVGELQSQNAELRHDIMVLELDRIEDNKSYHRQLGRLLNIYRKADSVLNVMLFQELQLGTFYC